MPATWRDHLQVHHMKYDHWYSKYLFHGCLLSFLDLPSKAKVVICGGGAQGAAIAYKLAQRGLGSDIVLIEQVKKFAQN